jgi:hypothetical protein
MPRERRLAFDSDSDEMEEDLDVEDGDLPGALVQGQTKIDPKLMGNPPQTTIDPKFMGDPKPCTPHIGQGPSGSCPFLRSIERKTGYPCSAPLPKFWPPVV